MTVAESRTPGPRILFCGLTFKAGQDWGPEVAQWERDAIVRLQAVGAQVIYREKPWRPGIGNLPDVEREKEQNRPLSQALKEVDGIATHHSNAAIEALAAGLPIYTETGIAKALSVDCLEDLPMASPHDIEARRRFLHEIAWHQWTLDEIAAGKWARPPGPLSDHPLLANATCP